MANEVVNSGARASADTTNIDEVINYLESPEYLRMIARQQGESPDSLLSGSRSQPWQSAPPVPAPEPAHDVLTPLRLHDGGMARVLVDRPWSAPLFAGDTVTLISDEYDPDEPENAHFRVRGTDGREWWVLTSDLSPITDGLADWERELLESATESVPTRVVFEDLDTETEAAPEFNEPTPSGARAATFGVRWGGNDRCTCARCLRRRMRVDTPARTPAPRRESRPVQLTTRDHYTEFERVMIDERRPFDTHGALRGRLRPESTESGYLRSKSNAAAQLWLADQDKIDYVVYSYNTPIAWHVKSATFNEWIYPDVRYSPTTGRHQSKIRAVLAADPVSNLRYIQEA